MKSYKQNKREHAKDQLKSHRSRARSRHAFFPPVDKSSQPFFNSIAINAGLLATWMATGVSAQNHNSPRDYSSWMQHGSRAYIVNIARVSTLSVSVALFWQCFYRASAPMGAYLHVHQGNRCPFIMPAVQSQPSCQASNCRPDHTPSNFSKITQNQAQVNNRKFGF